jgi:PAS domain S-box-containing protein
MDVTERKTREETIREQEAELRQILDLTPQLIAVYGANRERLYINRIALDYLGLSHEEWRQTREWGAFVHPDDRARERDYFDRALSTEVTVGFWLVPTRFAMTRDGSDAGMSRVPISKIARGRKTKSANKKQSFGKSWTSRHN